MKVWQCVVCGFIYDEAQGLPAEGIAPGTRWADIPEDWACPGLRGGQGGFRDDRDHGGLRAFTVWLEEVNP